MPLGQYEASFGIAGFDVRSNGYTSNVEGNRSARAVPWAPQYTVVIQQGGLNPLTRRYRVLFYAEVDLVAMAVLVNTIATLTTPREGSVQANLDSLAREDTDPNSPDGLTTATLNFTLVQ